MKKIISISVGLFFVLTLVVAVIYWNEASKEVTFLCGNFTKGSDEESVIRQLESANLSRGNFTLPDHSGVLT